MLHINPSPHRGIPDPSRSFSLPPIPSCNGNIAIEIDYFGDGGESRTGSAVAHLRSDTGSGNKAMVVVDPSTNHRRLHNLIADHISKNPGLHVRQVLLKLRMVE